MAHKDQYAGLTETLERVIAACTAEVVAAVDHLLQVMGPRPFGYQSTDLQGQLEYYLTIRDDPAYWPMWFQQNVPLIGAEAAASFAVKEATRLENKLAEQGSWTGDPNDLGRALQDGALVVRNRALMRYLGTAQKAVEAADEIEQRTPVLVTPPLNTPDELVLMQGVV